ncbi:MAG: TetR family transcriptional regulator [Bacteroidetes bacterium]|jgi:AcrR family transcriptional regulator|nr:TetR family transcriptional regulator [Bacteroidota bacterium]
MSSAQTKEKILRTALFLFNKDGFVNVRLQHITDEAIISLGNITYHYRTKDKIIMAIWEELKKEQKQLLSQFKALPLFRDIDNYLNFNFHLQQKYIFYYQDTLEVLRSYDEIAKNYREHTRWQTQQIMGMLTFNKARGALKSTLNSEFYSQRAELWVWLSENWVNRQAIHGRNTGSLEQYKKTMWHILTPLFTKEGVEEFQQISQTLKTYDG